MKSLLTDEEQAVQSVLTYARTIIANKAERQLINTVNLNYNLV